MLLDPLKATLFEVLLNRRSRRVGLGMSIPAGPFQYTSPHEPVPLTEDEEAALAFAACGVTGYALADLSYGPQEGGSMLVGRLGRTVASPDAVNAVAVLVTNDRGTWLLKRPQDFAVAEFPELVRLARNRALTDLYKRGRIQLSDRRAAPPLDSAHNFSINRWSLYAPGTTYFLPIIETTALTINALLELFGEGMGIFLRDERAWFRPAGIGRFASGKGGHLYEKPHDLRTATIQMMETALLESMATEHGMVLQNLALMTEALGLGGFPNFARHEYSWFKAAGFRMYSMPASRYAGAPRVLSTLARWVGRDPLLAYPVGLEKDNQVVLKPFCPPYYESMEDAVRAFVQTKFGTEGTYRGGVQQSAWRDAASCIAKIPEPSAAAVQATIAYCDYVFRRYGRFPAYTAPFRTIIGFQVCRVDVDFYARFYDSDGVSDAVRACSNLVPRTP
jgi:nitroreductase